MLDGILYTNRGVTAGLKWINELTQGVEVSDLELIYLQNPESDLTECRSTVEENR